MTERSLEIASASYAEGEWMATRTSGGIDTHVEQTKAKLAAQGPLGAHLAKVYVHAIETDPSLRNVDVEWGNPKKYWELAFTGGLARHQDTTSSGRPLVVMNDECSFEHFEALLTERGASVAACAEKLGIRPEEFTAKRLATFIFLHELGHAHDYLHNHPNHEQYRAKREEELKALPVQGYNPAQLKRDLAPDGKLESWYIENKEQIARAGFPTIESLVHAQEVAYHNMPSEDYPDCYAKKMLDEWGVLIK